MQQWLRQLALCFAAGSAGGFAKGALVWCLAHSAATAGFGLHLAAAQQPAGLYARIVWGGLYAFLFALPVARSSWLFSGLLWGAIVSALQLIALPLLLHGMPHLAFMPVVAALVLNCAWGLVTAALLRLIG